MAGTTHYQKLSLQLDAENSRLKAKLSESKKQIADLKDGTTKTAKGFKESFGQMGGSVGAARGSMEGLLDTVGSLHPAVLLMTAAAGAAGLMFKDLTAYTSEWEGATSSAGRTLTAMTNGLKTFWEEASEGRGKALAEGGVWGWVKEASNQLMGLTNGSTQAMMGAYAGAEDVINSFYIKWQNGILDTIQRQAELKAKTAELLNIARENKTEDPTKSLEALSKYKALASELYQIEKSNAQSELEYLEKINEVRGSTIDELLKIEQAKAAIADAERNYHTLVGTTIRLETAVNNALDKQLESRRDALLNMPDIQRQELDPSIKATALQDEIKLNKELMGVEGAKMQQASTDAMSLGQQLKEIRASSIKGLIAEGIAAVISKALAFLPPPFSLVAAGTAAAGAMALFSKLIPSFDVGTDYVPNDMMAMIHKGERIIPASQNKQQSLVAVVRGSDLHFVMGEYDRKRSNSF